MTGYTEGKHSDSVDTQDRLVRVGSKYQATAPSVADGDSVYLLVDAAGRPLVVGPAAHDAAALGSPLRSGGVYRTTLPGVAAADIADMLVSAEGRPRTEEYLVQQSRVGNEKNTQGSTAKTTTGNTGVGAWTVTSGKDGYLVSVQYAVRSHASETNHTIELQIDAVRQFLLSRGQGDFDGQ